MSFGKLDLSEIQKEDSRVNTESTGSSWSDNYVQMPKVKAGQTAVLAVRILPPAPGKKLYEYTRYQSVNGRRIHDPKRLIDGKWDKSTPNPLVDAYNELWAKADKAENAGNKDESERLKAEARAIKPVDRYYYNAIVRKMTDENGNVQTNVGPKILSVGKVLHKLIMRAFVGDETEAALGDVTDPETGYDLLIKIEMRGTGGESYPNYDRSTFAKTSSPLGTMEEIKVWAENLHDLSKNHVVTPYETLKKEWAIWSKLIPDDKAQSNTDKLREEFLGKSEVVATKTSTVVEDTPEPEVVDEVPDVAMTEDEFLKQMHNLEVD